MTQSSPKQTKKSSEDDDPSQPPLEEHQPPEIYSHIALTEAPFGDSVFDDYEAIEKVAEGGSGEIWTIRKRTENDDDDVDKGRIFAMKTIDKHFLFGTHMKELRNEIEILRLVDHPNVVRILELYETRNDMYLIMEYCSGGDLWARSSSCYTEEEAARIMNQVLSAVALCHKQKIVHRDIKYENILFESKSKDSQVKLIDFGMSQKYRKSRGEYTMKLQVGTTYTTAPEVIDGKYQETADIWSCGVVAYMLLTGGKRPFDGESNAAILEAVKKAEYTLDGPEWENVSQEAKEFVSSLLQKDPEKRWVAEECLESAWLSKYNINRSPPTQVMDDVKDALLHCDEEPHLKRLAKMIIAHCAPAKKLIKLRQAFDEIMETRDGTITREEFASALETCDVTQDHIEELFSELDQNNTGVINYSEFLSATLEIQEENDEELLKEAFEKLDVDNSGAITTEGLAELMDTKNQPTSGEEVAADILAEVDVVKKGEVNFDEFVEMFNEDEKGSE